MTTEGMCCTANRRRQDMTTLRLVVGSTISTTHLGDEALIAGAVARVAGHQRAERVPCLHLHRGSGKH